MVKIDHVYESSIYASVQFSSVVQSCPTVQDPMNRSMLGLPVHHQLPEFTQTHVLLYYIQYISIPELTTHQRKHQVILNKVNFQFLKKGLFLKEEKNLTHLIKYMFFDEDQTSKFPHLLSCNIKMKFLYHFSFFFWTFTSQYYLLSKDIIFLMLQVAPFSQIRKALALHSATQWVRKHVHTTPLQSERLFLYVSAC